MIFEQSLATSTNHVNFKHNLPFRNSPKCQDYKDFKQLDINALIINVCRYSVICNTFSVKFSCKVYLPNEMLKLSIGVTRNLRSVFKLPNITNKENILFFCTAPPPIKIKQKIGFIGDGAMAKAICRSIKRKGLIQYSQVYVSSPYIKNLDNWKELGANVSTDNSVVAKESDVIFLAVKPHILCDALDQIVTSPNAKEVKNKLFISILAGITIKDLEQILSRFEGSRVVRVMPNTPMLIGKGCTVYCPGTTITEDDMQLVKSILEVTGMCQMIPEHMINAVGAVSASGPAFVYIFIEALSDGGVRMGLHREMATRFAAQTVMGAANMVLETNKHMGTLKDEVCSAGGQTIAGIHAMERCAVRGAIMDAVEAAALKAAELGEKPKK